MFKIHPSRLPLQRTRSASAAAGALLVSCALMLAACSENPAPSTPSPQTSPADSTQNSVKVAVARGKIEVEGGLVELAAASSGLVAQLAAREGETVKAGQVLLRLDDHLAEQAIAVATAEVRLARERLRLSEVRLPELRANAHQHAKAAQAGAVPAQQAQAAQQRLTDAQAEVAVVNAELAVAEQRLEMARTEKSQGVLKAPEAGVVVGINTQKGAFVQAGAKVLTLLPQRPLVVRAELNSTYVDAVQVGMLATVSPETDGADGTSSLPAARVVRISPMYGHGRLQDESQRGPVRVVECVLEFEHAPQRALVGQNVRIVFHE